jgi:hypothetical protein
MVKIACRSKTSLEKTWHDTPLIAAKVEEDGTVPTMLGSHGALPRLTSVFRFRVVVLNEYCLRAGSYYEAWPSIVVCSLSSLSSHLSAIPPRTYT